MKLINQVFVEITARQNSADPELDNIIYTDPSDALIRNIETIGTAIEQANLYYGNIVSLIHMLPATAEHDGLYEFKIECLYNLFALERIIPLLRMITLINYVLEELILKKQAKLPQFLLKSLKSLVSGATTSSRIFLFMRKTPSLRLMVLLTFITTITKLSLNRVISLINSFLDIFTNIRTIGDKSVFNNLKTMSAYTENIVFKYKRQAVYQNLIDNASDETFLNMVTMICSRNKVLI